jgi:hypothetical protein
MVIREGVKLLLHISTTYWFFLLSILNTTVHFNGLDGTAYTRLQTVWYSNYLKKSYVRHFFQSKVKRSLGLEGVLVCSGRLGCTIAPQARPCLPTHPQNDWPDEVTLQASWENLEVEYRKKILEHLSHSRYSTFSVLQTGKQNVLTSSGQSLCERRLILFACQIGPLRNKIS